MLAIYGIVGLAVGSFLNVVIDRLPRGGRLVFPSSRCDSCKRALSWWENIPLASYVFLKGKCRTCGARIPLRVLWVELITCLLFVFLWWHYGASLQLAIATVYTCIFLALAVIDLEHKLPLTIQRNSGLVSSLSYVCVLSAFLLIKGMRSFAEFNTRPSNRLVTSGLTILSLDVRARLIPSRGFRRLKSIRCSFHTLS